jgi:glycerate-2-kinase
VDTDGIDGTGPLSGAVLWPALAAELLPRAAEALGRSDSASLFLETQGALRWGPTGANVSDLCVVLRDGARIS